MRFGFGVVIVGLAAAYAAWILTLWHFQERIVFQPPRAPAGRPAGARQVRYRTADDVDLFAFVVGDYAAHATVLLAFHGNADIARWFVPWAIEVVRRTGACVVLPEYRGYDGLPGRPSYTGSALDARAALKLVRTEMNVSPENIVFFGHSLGTAIVAELAAVDPPRSLILQSPFSSARAMARRMVIPGVNALWGAISRVHFDTVERVRRLGRVVSVAHGERDLIVPVRMGIEVFHAAANPGEILLVTDAGHNDVAEAGGQRYWDWLGRAISSVTPAEHAPGSTGVPARRSPEP